MAIATLGPVCRPTIVGVKVDREAGADFVFHCESETNIDRRTEYFAK